MAAFALVVGALPILDTPARGLFQSAPPNGASASACPDTSGGAGSGCAMPTASPDVVGAPPVASDSSCAPATADATCATPTVLVAGPRNPLPSNKPLAASPTRAPTDVPPESDRFLGTETSYDLRAAVDYDAETISVVETVTVTNTASEPIPVLNFSILANAFDEFELTSGPFLNGRHIEGRWTNRANLALPLDPPLRTGQEATVEFGFVDRPSAKVEDDLDQHFSLADGILQAADWFPILSSGHGAIGPGDGQFTAAAKVIRFDVTLDRPMPLAAPGRQVLASPTHSIFELPNARNYTFAVSPGYRHIRSWAGRIPLDIYYTDGNPASLTGWARLALSSFGSSFGRYPWDRLVIAQASRDEAALEWPAMITLGAKDMANRTFVVHEIAHQWWYGIVGNDQINSPWLDEGFAEFSTRDLLGLANDYESRTPVSCPVTCWDSWWRGPGSYSQTTYYKATQMLRDLRDAMGARRFWDALRDIQGSYRFGVLTTPAAVATFETWAPDRARADAILHEYGVLP